MCKYLTERGVEEQVVKRFRSEKVTCMILTDLAIETTQKKRPPREVSKEAVLVPQATIFCSYFSYKRSRYYVIECVSP